MKGSKGPNLSDGRSDAGRNILPININTEIPNANKTIYVDTVNSRQYGMRGANNRYM